jgi:hypothetical protein
MLEGYSIWKVSLICHVATSRNSGFSLGLHRDRNFISNLINWSTGMFCKVGFVCMSVVCVLTVVVKGHSLVSAGLDLGEGLPGAGDTKEAIEGAGL